MQEITIICDPRVLVIVVVFTSDLSVPYNSFHSITQFIYSESVIVSPTECIAIDFVDTYTVGILTTLVMIGNPVRIISSIYKGHKIH